MHTWSFTSSWVQNAIMIWYYFLTLHLYHVACSTVNQWYEIKTFHLQETCRFQRVGGKEWKGVARKTTSFSHLHLLPIFNWILFYLNNHWLQNGKRIWKIIVGDWFLSSCFFLQYKAYNAVLIFGMPNICWLTVQGAQLQPFSAGQAHLLQLLLIPPYCKCLSILPLLWLTSFLFREEWT